MPKLSFNGHADNRDNGGILRNSEIPGCRGTTPKVETSAP